VTLDARGYEGTGGTPSRGRRNLWAKTRNDVLPPWHDSRMLGVLVRVHAVDCNDLGVAHLPPPIELGDLVCLQHSEHRIVDVVESPSRSAVYALVKVRPAQLRPLVRAH
jgi:hypothetical protein